MQSSRRIVFNPTSIPGLRSRGSTRRDFYNAGYAPTSGLRKAKDVGFWRGIRKESTETGENQTGHISARPNEGILWFDSKYSLGLMTCSSADYSSLDLFPLKLNWMLRLPWHAEKSPQLLTRFNNSTLGTFEPVALVKRAIPSSVPMTVTEILPRLKDGGAFVKFSHPNGISAKEVEGLLREYLRENPIKPWFNPFRRIRTNLVVGKPWLEDLYRFPSARIRVEFAPTSPGKEAAELSQEALYSLFRKYGKIAEITPQPSDSKILPKYAHLDFARLRQAIMARNCMHGLKVTEAEGGGAAGTQLRLSFQQREKTHWVWEWLSSHPRVVIPAVAALLATATVAVFDPIRTFFIKAHIEHSFHLQDNRLYQWFKSQATDIFTFRHRRSEETSMIWEDRKQVIDTIQTALMETSSTFIVVQGPRGSGKKDLLNEALKGRRNTLLIDCKPIQDARGDSATIGAAASAVGYRPVFSWANSLSSLVDLAAQGTIGVKSGFSETLDAQLGKIWGNTASALKSAALGNRPKAKEDKDAALSDDDWLEAHPEHRPVVLLDNFLHKNEESSIVYDKLSEWAAGLTTANIAHVVFLTNDISYSKSLSKALPDRVFRQISLGDIKPQVAKKFVISHLDVEKSDPNTVGGRLTDLEFLARRLKTGQTPTRAIAEMIEQSANEIMKMYLLTIDKGDRKYSREQAWYLIKSLSEHGSLRYNEILLTNTFASSLSPSAASGEGALEALTAAELVTISSYKGRPQTVKAGKPIYEAAFKILAEDKVLKSRLDLAVLTELTKIETKSIDKYETELTMLGTLPRQPAELAPRIQFLLAKIAASQQKVEAWEKDMSAMKKLLLDEY
ncbi:related to mitochondrial rRNA processing protein PRP12 [Rhynchosporium graminicola]|uniref:Mitochondrial escape protein 2 n=1 Tax=Rhynchosporium graminicola TaxID=2792576 RepID=A0A1E1KH27_9HELO|nr:related to mitochondrial rRNA processing protein PRP12 [Rhynchosporium commune]